MTTSTLTLADTTAALAVVADIVPAPDALAAAVAAVSVASDTDNTARDTLAAIVLARYTFRAIKHVRTVAGVTVLPDDKRKEVASLLWLDATGNVTPPTVKGQTAGEKAMREYVSRHHRVAVNLAYGVSHLATVESAETARKAIADSESAAKANEAGAQLALDSIADREAFNAWLGIQPQDVRTAFRKVAHALKFDAAAHVTAFIDTLND